MNEDYEIIYVDPHEGYEYMIAAASVRTVRLGISEIVQSRQYDFHNRLRSAVPEALGKISAGIEAYQLMGMFGDPESEESKRQLSAWIIAIFNDAAVAVVDAFNRELITESN